MDVSTTTSIKLVAKAAFGSCFSRAYLFEVVQVPLVVLARPVSWEVCGLLVRDCFGADSERLVVILAKFKPHNPSRVSTLRLISSSAAGVDIVAAVSSSLVFPWGALSNFTKSSRKAPTAKADAPNGGRPNLVASSMCGTLPSNATTSLSTLHAH